jgi:hypothetical protein
MDVCVDVEVATGGGDGGFVIVVFAVVEADGTGLDVGGTGIDAGGIGENFGGAEVKGDEDRAEVTVAGN